MGNDDQQAQVQMLLQQQNAQSQQAPQAQQTQVMQQAAPTQHQMQLAAHKHQGLNPMANNMFQRNFPMAQDTSGTLAMNMQNYIQSQQASQQQQRVQQQQVAQQSQQSQQPQMQAQQQQQQPTMMRSQFNIGQNQGNQTNMNSINPSNIYTHQQQAYAANLAAAQQRQGGLSTLNQPINPTIQAQQAQQISQQRPGQFAQMQGNNALQDPKMFNQQLRNPLQSPAQLQQPLPQAEIQKMGRILRRINTGCNILKIIVAKISILSRI